MSASSAAINAIARSAKRQAAELRATEQIANAKALFGAASEMATGNVATRRALMKAQGRGMYTLGSGAYKLGKAMRKFGAGKFGQALQGAAVNRIVGTGGMGMYTGRGAYAATNDIIGGDQGSSGVVPLFQSAGAADEGVVISRREYVSEIYGPPLDGALPAPFSLQSFPINVGLEGTFPWLSQIAANYDEYELQQLIFTFKSTTTESSTAANGQVGTIIMATNYNAAAPVFTDKVTMLQYAHANSDRITASMQHGVECDPDKLSGSAGEYIRNNPVVSGQDLKTYDHGKFQIAVANCAAPYANVSLGELWVSYTVVLRKPKFYTAIGLAISKDIFCSVNGTETREEPLGPVGRFLKGQQNNIGCRVDYPIPNQMRVTFPAAYRGAVRLMFVVAGAQTGTPPVASVYTEVSVTAPTKTGNVVFQNDLYGASQTGVTTATATNPGEIDDNPNAWVQVLSLRTGFIIIVHAQVTVATNGTDNAILFNYFLNTVGTPSQGYLEISEYNSGFSYLATGLGSSADPVFVSPSGSIVKPF